MGTGIFLCSREKWDLGLRELNRTCRIEFEPRNRLENLGKLCLIPSAPF